MGHTVVAIMSFSIVFAAIIGLVRFKKIDQSYYPFIYIIWLGLANEILSFFLIRTRFSNAVNSNIYVLLEAVLLLWFFQAQSLFKKARYLLLILVIFYILTWAGENFWFSSIRLFSSYFIVFYSFVTVILSIHLINTLLSKTARSILKNAAFQLSIGLILFFTCKILIEIFWIYGLNSSRSFRLQVYRIMTFVNLFVNLLFAAAILWIPRRQEFTLRY